MKSLQNISKLSLLGLSLLVTFAACSAVNNDVESLTDEDIELATQILTESVSDESSGIMSSMYDAVSSVGSDGISYRDSQDKAKHNDRSGRGREGSYSYTYDPETGTHTLQYNRSVTNGTFSKSVSLLNTYIFKSPEGDFVVRPRANADSIESVDFTGSKSGSVESRRRNSEFARLDTFSIAGLHSTSSIVSIDGTHHGEGSASGVTSDSVEASRDYTVNIELSNVEIVKDTVEANGNLEQGVTGTLTYSIVLNKTFGDRSDTKEIEGTIEMDGDGTALLRFKRILKTIRFSLKDGSTQD
tara:strand:- start:5887 stop:6786 length:900 start_codon:yes stop_codon:yes gene_type:complete